MLARAHFLWRVPHRKGSKGSSTRCQGVLWDPRTPSVSSHVGDEQLPLAEQRGEDALHARLHAIAQARPRPRDLRAWEKQVLSARGFKRVERHSE
jgi:hypothetical protein